MNLKEVFVADLKATLEETSNVMADRVILESLAKNGTISLNEAEFYDSLVRRVVTEAAEEFVPDSINLSYLQEMADMEQAQAGAPMAGDVMILTDEAGATYQYNPATGELTPVQQDAEQGEEGLAGIESNEAGQEDGITESAQAAKDKELTESTEESEVEQQELTESQLIVSNLIKSLGA